MSTTTKPPRKKATAGTWVLRVVITVVVLILVGVVSLVVVNTYGRISGLEFSPDTFRTRSFQYTEIPLLEVQISKVKYSPVSSPVVDNMVANQWIPAAPAGPVTWHQVNRRRAGEVVWQGDPMILLYYLDVPDYVLAKGRTFPFSFGSPDSEWVEFNNDHPALAAILWPAIVELARNDLYMYMPEVLDLARQARRAEDFQADLDAYLTETYTFVGVTRTKLGEYQAAIVAFDAALAHTPDHAEALEGRAEANKAAGDSEDLVDDETQAP